MKRWFFLMLAVVFVAGGVLSIAIAQADKIVIDNKYPAKKKNPVTLAHKMHIDKGVACTECHHTWKKEESKTPQKCAECHKADDTGPTGLKNAYHSQCYKGCHKKRKAEGKPTGPTGLCSACHPK